jgi:hypothetical protein
MTTILALIQTTIADRAGFSLINLAGTVLASLVSALTIGAILVPLIRRYTLRVFDEDVMGALKRERAKYREFHSEVFQSELDRGRRTADIASGLQHDLTGHIDEFRRFRNEYSGHQELLITIPQTVVHLDATIKRLDRTFEQFGEQVGRLREDVAELRGGR